MIAREPSVAGAFYPGRADELNRALDAAFAGPRGPGGGPRRSEPADASLRALVVPHAGYEFSGEIAARAYRVAGEAARPAAVLLLGANHEGVGRPFALSELPWRTPLGTTRVASELLSDLRGGVIEVDEEAHRYEHSIEVQVPFLQRVLPGVPLAMLSVRYASEELLRRVGARVAAAVRDRPVLLIASTDFSHYVPAEVARREDALAVAAIERRDPDGLRRLVVERDLSMCGVAPTTVLLEALAPEALRVTSLGWGHSGEVAPMRTVVGYAALRLDRSAPGGGTGGPADALQHVRE